MHACTNSPFSFPQFMFPNYYHNLFFLKLPLTESNRKLESKEYFPPVTIKRNAGCREAHDMGRL